MSQHLVGLAEVAQFLGIVSRGKRPGNRLWELMRAGRLKQFPHVLIRHHYAQEYGVLLESSFPDFLDIYEAKKSWKTDSYRERVMSALRLMPFEHFPNAEAVERYRDERLKKSAASTVRQDLAALHD